jgi:hypothetical protein
VRATGRYNHRWEGNGLTASTEVWRLLMTGNDYLAIIRQLPRPTLAQTERFARYVSGAHSWYKHLPIRRKVPFVFFLDPGAGMNLVRTRAGEIALVECGDQNHPPIESS